MINEETRRKLREINLGEAIKGLEVQQADPATIALPFDERMQRLVDYIYQEKYNGKIQRLIKSAKLRFPQANRQGVIYVFFVKYFSLKKASEFPFFSKGFSLPSAGIMHPCA